MNPYLSIIIPAYNEEKRIKKTLLEIDKYLTRREYEYEILVVDDGSEDKTADLIRNFLPIIKNLKLVSNKQNHGKGWAVRQGMLEARGKIRLFMDADNATTIDHFEKMIPYFQQGCEIVIGSRSNKDVKGAGQIVPQNFLKRLLGRMGNLLIQIFVVPGIWDTQCGFKAFSDKAAKEIFFQAKIDRWAFDIEILTLARKMKFKIAIVPIRWINDPLSKVSFKDYLRIFGDLFRIKYNLKRE